jgi:hypothetical protein
MVDEPMTPPEEHEGTQESQTEGTAPPPEMRTEDALHYAIGLFSELAWIHLGLHASPVSGETKADQAQARLAIDAIAALVPLTEGRFPPHEVRDLNNLLSSLRLNFVQRM